MNKDFQPLGKRIGYKLSDAAWAAHAAMRRELLRERFGALVGERR